MRITICGGGALGHVCAAFLASQPRLGVSLLTGHPDAWDGEVEAVDPSGKVFRSRLDLVTDDVTRALDGADMVLLCQPGFLIRQTLERIRPHIKDIPVGSVVSSTGFFFEAEECIPQHPVFGFQRVPFIARVKEYGRSAQLLGYKDKLAVATRYMPEPEAFARRLGELFATPTSLLDSYLEAALTNSNPILHTGRLYSMFHGWNGRPMDRQILFYREWDLASSELIVEMDGEFGRLREKLGIGRENLPTLLDYYESGDAGALTAKLASIAAFRDIPAPMKPSGDGWVPDAGSRYFTEDFPYGLYYIKRLAHENGVAVPTIDAVYDWGMNFMLRQRYNPEGSLLRRAQLRMLHILEVVDGICRREGIPYWLDAGTLLGAVRHKGFIPWDDDMDICILKKDYKRFKKAALESLPPDLAYQDWTTDPNHFEMSPRIRDLNSLFDQPESRCQKYRGLFLDVILVERVPNMKVKKFICFFYRRVSREMHGYGKVAYKSPLRRFAVKALAYLAWPAVWLMTSIARLHAAAIRSDVMSRYYTHFPAPRCISDIFPCRDIAFEGRMFSAPAHPDRYLEKMFGDYMKLPPESEREGHSCPIEIYD